MISHGKRGILGSLLVIVLLSGFMSGPGVRALLGEVPKDIQKLENQTRTMDGFGSGLNDDPPQASAQAKSAAAARGSLTISSFKKHVDPGTAVFQPGSATINFGENVRLSWRIDGCHAGDVMARIKPGLSPGRESDQVEPGRRVDDGNGCFHMTNTVTVAPRDTTTYTLSAYALPVGTVAPASKAFTVNVRRPRLVVGYPELNLRDYRVRFSVINRGELDLASTPLVVHFRVIGTKRDSDETGQLQDAMYTTPAMSVPRGQRVDLGEQVLHNRPAFAPFSGIRIEVEVIAGPISSGWTSYNFRLEPLEFEVGNNLWEFYGSTVDGTVRINNFDQSVTSDTVNRAPLRRDDCSIRFSDELRTFNLGHIGFRVTILGSTAHFRFYVSDLTARLGGTRFLSMVDRKLRMRVVFDTDGGPEVKGWRQDPDNRNRFVDGPGPDLDLTRAEADLFLTLGLREGRLTYTNVEARPVIDFVLAGRWEWLTLAVRDRLKGDLTEAVGLQVAGMMMGEDVRRDFEDAMAQAFALRGIDRIAAIRIGPAGDRIYLTYYR